MQVLYHFEALLGRVLLTSISVTVQCATIDLCWNSIPQRTCARVSLSILVPLAEMMCIHCLDTADFKSCRS